MENLENQITLQNLERAKPNLVPHVFSENYFRILRLKLENKELTYNERYYYNHFIKKKLKGALELFAVEDFNIHGKQFMLAERIKKANMLLKEYSKKHKGMKILISGSFLFNEKYNDIDIFILSKYNKEDYRDEKVHVNYLPVNVQNTLFFKSISKISMTNFRIEQTKITEKISIEDFFQLYEYLVLLIMQKDDYLIELRDFLLKAEYLSSKTILNPLQLKLLTERIMKYKKTNTDSQ